MPHTAVWIHTAVFYKQSHWHSMFTHCLSPFIKEMRGKKILENYFLHFSAEQGEHLRVSFKTDANNSKKIKKGWQQVLELYLSKNPCPVSTPTYPLESFFMDFPTNSYVHNHHKLYPSLSPLLNFDELLNLRQTLSNCILKAFIDENIDKESIFTFCLYLQLALLKAFHKNYASALLSLKSISNYLCNNLLITGQINIDRKVFLINDENDATIPEIIQDVWGVDVYQKDLYWLNDWVKWIKKNIGTKPTNELFIEFSQILFEHLNITDSTALTVNTNLLYLNLLKLKTI